ncbi:MAG: glycosyltransferase, partial [Candidatus Omnitrophica bacterium]|nr:glycosyltransferase [Candidatus Omnitrophota bacterium]
SQFPCYDETFILREIHCLSKRIDVVIFSLRKSKDKIVHNEASELISKTTYVPYLFSWKVVKAQIRVFVMQPFGYLRALFRLVIGNFKSPEFLFKSLAFFPKSVYLAKWLKEKKVTHIHAHWATYPASVALTASEISGIPFSFTGHAHDIYLNATHLREKMMRAAFVVTCTRQNKQHLMKMAPSYSGDRVMVSYHGVDLEKFKVNGKVRNDTFQILSVGTLQYHKGFQYLLPALEILKKSGANFRCTLVGGGPLESDIRKHIRLLGLESYVAMTGPLKQNEVLQCYRKSDLFILMAQPEWHWGIPNVLIEALAAKTPVITTRFGSVEELVQDGETGLMVPPKDSVILAQTIDRLYHDHSLRIKLAEAGHRLVLERFDLEKNVQKLSEQFQNYESTALLV